MSNAFNEAQAIAQWQLESSMPDASMPRVLYGMSQLFSTMSAAAQNSLLEGCPVFIGRTGCIIRCRYGIIVYAGR